MTTSSLIGWTGFDLLGFHVAGWVRERRPAHHPLFDCWIERGELFVTFGKREAVVTPPWWRSGRG